MVCNALALTLNGYNVMDRAHFNMADDSLTFRPHSGYEATSKSTRPVCFLIAFFDGTFAFEATRVLPVMLNATSKESLAAMASGDAVVMAETLKSANCV